jgi:ADP-ribosylglycohydrolase
LNVSCQDSVPESLIAVLQSTDYESEVRNAVSFGGDADTVACIADGIAEAFYGGIPEKIAADVEARPPKELVNMVHLFGSRCGFVSRLHRP